MTWRYDTHPSFASRSQLGQATLGLFVASPVAAIRLRPHALRTGTTDGHTGHGPWRKCGRERAERMASEAGIPGGWLALA